MIQLLEHTSLESILHSKFRGWAAARIRASVQAYRESPALMRFYSNPSGGAQVALQDSFAVCCSAASADTEELAQFLPYIAASVLSDRPLPLERFPLTRGRVYSSAVAPSLLPETTSDLQAGYEVLSQVFPAAINAESYSKWYADLSHRIRHGMSEICSLRGIATVTLHYREGGILYLSHLATLPEFRGKGHARSLIAHLAALHPQADSVTLLSQDANSDRFYEHLGFSQTEEYYYYKYKG